MYIHIFLLSSYWIIPKPTRALTRPTVSFGGLLRQAYHEFSLWWETEDRWGLLNLTEEQKLALYQVGEYFQYYDEDRTGTLDWEQFSNVYQYMYDAGYDLTLTVEECLLQVDTTHDELVNYNEFIVWMVKLGVLESKGIKRTDLSAKDVQSAKKKGRRASFFDATSVFSCNVEEEVEEEEVDEDAAKLDKVHEEIEEIGE